MQNIFGRMGIIIDGMSTVPVLLFSGDEIFSRKTFFTQEMLKRGFLASNVIYLSLTHCEAIIDSYAAAASDIFDQSKIQFENGSISKLLDGDVCHSGFQRLT